MEEQGWEEPRAPRGSLGAEKGEELSGAGSGLAAAGDACSHEICGRDTEFTPGAGTGRVTGFDTD